MLHAGAQGYRALIAGYAPKDADGAGLPGEVGELGLDGVDAAEEGRTDVFS